MEKAIVLFSGGLDSTTCLAIAQNDGFEPCALSFRYNQRHEAELRAAEMILRRMNISTHLVLDLPLGKIGGSSLTSADMEVEKDRKSEGDQDIPNTYVPARNTIFLSCALGWAEVLGALHIYIGINALDYSGYPDCRPEFIAAYQHMANLATKESVEGRLQYTFHTPLLYLTKAQIIQKGVELGVDYSETHSCYDPSPGGLACGRCDSCILRRKGFQEAGVPDPTRYIPEAP
jgi:7-cyano-7-deazaguanine synthase